MEFMYLLSLLTPMLAASDEGGEAALIPLILLASGFIFYFVMYSRYRNADKRHSHEVETEAYVANLGVVDQFMQHRKGLKNAKMKGANHLRIEGAQNIGGSTPKFLDVAKQISSHF